MDLAQNCYSHPPLSCLALCTSQWIGATNQSVWKWSDPPSACNSPRSKRLDRWALQCTHWQGLCLSFLPASQCCFGTWLGWIVSVRKSIALQAPGTVCGSSWLHSSSTPCTMTGSLSWMHLSKSRPFKHTALTNSHLPYSNSSSMPIQAHLHPCHFGTGWSQHWARLKSQ